MNKEPVCMCYIVTKKTFESVLRVRTILYIFVTTLVFGTTLVRYLCW